MLLTTAPEIAATAGLELVISHRWVTSIGGPELGFAVTMICCWRFDPWSKMGVGSMLNDWSVGNGSAAAPIDGAVIPDPIKATIASHISRTRLLRLRCMAYNL